jgi:predicted S18 family serine protease
MTTDHNWSLLPSLILLVAVAAPAVAQTAPPTITLDQAAIQVQQDTGGKILSADSRKIGRRLEYRIKVLTPEGHVQVMAISSEPSKNPAPTSSTKNPPGKSTGSKEKH